MNAVFEIAAPVFGLLLLGYVAVKARWFDETATRGLSRFVFDFAVPALLLRTLAATPLPETIPWGLFLSFYGPIAVAYGGGLLIARCALGMEARAAALFGMGCSFGNTVLLGLPLALRSLGEEGALPYLLIVSVHGLILLTLTTVLVELGNGAGSGGGVARAALGLARSPIILSMAAGLGCNLLGVPLTGFVDDVCGLLQEAVTPCALFAVGGALARYGVAGQLGPTTVMIAIKSLCLPLGVWVLAGPVFALEPSSVASAVLCAAQPTGVMVYVFAQKHGAVQSVAASAVLLSTALSIVTIPIVLALLVT